MAETPQSRRTRRLILAGIAASIAIAIAIGLFDREIDAEAATGIADSLADRYRAGSGERAAHFAGREVRQWADGWEVRWRYRPCADFASLRIWISRDGRRARYAELPDCTPERGFGPAPRKA